MKQVWEVLGLLFPMWVGVAGLGALAWPEAFGWVSDQIITVSLGIIMLAMGMTLSLEDFRRVAHCPGRVAIGFIAQYSIMPGVAWLVARGMDLPPGFAAGLILVACCPGGTASNVVTFLARGDVALSVVMTTVSTVAAVVMTPWLTAWLAGAYVPVDSWGLMRTTAAVVLLPVAAGLALSHFAPGMTRAATAVAPLLSGLLVALIVGAITAKTRDTLLTMAGPLVVAVALLHIGGFAIGYGAGWLLGAGPTVSRTISIEVGMQNSGLGATLARNHFPDPLSAAACVISAVTHCVIGSLAAGYWRWRGG